MSQAGLKSTLFRSRLGALAVMMALGFLVILGRLWQLQVVRYEKYNALATRDEGIERIIPALRGPIYDRHGAILAEDQPFYDISVRLDRLKLESLKVDDVKAARQAAKNDDEREVFFEKMTTQLRGEPFVRRLAATLKYDDEEIARNLLKGMDTVARGWSSPRTPLRVASGVDEAIWIALRSAHEDVFQDSNLLFGKKKDGASDVSDKREPPFPGLVCTVSARRVYPRGTLACFVLGALGELSIDEEDVLRQDGVLFEQGARRSKRWKEIRESLSEERADELELILKSDPREMRELGTLYEILKKMRPAELQWLEARGLAEPVAWIAKPPRMVLSEAEMLWLGTGLPLSGKKNVLPNRVIGELGVERSLNYVLRQKHGMKIRTSVDAKDTDDDAMGFQNSAPREGDPVALTISLAWQMAVEKSLAGFDTPRAAVVIDVKTGEVLAMASFPNFDPNLFVPPRDGKLKQQQLRALLKDLSKPLLNRAISEQYPLGSVMKTLVAAIALEKGVLSPTETMECSGSIIEGGQRFRCDESRAHGTVNLFKGLRCSCNTFYCQIGARLGVEGMAPIAKLILGRRSGIDIPGETPGIYPDREWREKNFPKDPYRLRWTKGNDFHLAIGQGMMTSTVLQSAVIMAAISNGGYVVTPHLWLDGPTPAPKSLGISPQNLDLVRQALEEVVNVGRPGERGTAYSPFHEQGPMLPIKVAGKTSTAEHKVGAKSHAWFSGYAPADNPQVAFAVIVEEAGHGGATAAPVVYQFLKEIYGTHNHPNPNPGGPIEAEVAQPVAQGE